MWLLALLAAAPARVTEPAVPERGAVQLYWRAPEGCPSQESVERLIRELLGRSAVGRDVEVNARVERLAANRWALSLALVFPGGRLQRELIAETCELTASATALVTAVVLDPTTMFEELAPALPVPAAAAEPAAREPVPDTKPNERSVAPTPTALARIPTVSASGPASPTRTIRGQKPVVRGLARVDVVAGLGVLPGLAAGVEGAMGIDAAWLRVELVASYAGPREARSDIEPSAGARVDLWTVGSRGCWAGRHLWVEVPLCLGVDFGQMRGEGVGLTVSRRARAFWGAAHAVATMVVVPLRWLGLRISADGWVGFARPGFRIDDLDRVHRPERAGVSVIGGVEARFP